VKILYLTQRLPFGHGETFVVPEIEALLARGHEVLIVPRLSRDQVLHDDAVPLVARTRMLPSPRGVVRAVTRTLIRRPRLTLRTFWRLRRTRPRPRTYSNTIATAQGIWVADLARAWGADHIHAHWAHLTATMAMAASAFSGIPWSFTGHRYDVVLNNLLADKLRSARFGRFIARRMLEHARPLVEPEAMARATVLYMGLSLPPRPSGEPPERVTPMVVCPARMVPVKGHSYLLEAAALLGRRGIRFELVLAGDGPERPDIARRIGELGLGDRVRMAGITPHAELLRRYRDGEVDCVVLPSLDLGAGLHEGISVALIEAMAHGVPVVSTSTGGQPELLGDGSGIMVPPADADALADALERLLTSRALRLELGQRGRRRIERDFDVGRVADELTRRFAGANGASSHA
jgi:colanic acid/amylovoran biosynthesis glycosyltransferase